jgi:hypothetical protein
MNLIIFFLFLFNTFFYFSASSNYNLVVLTNEQFKSNLNYITLHYTHQCSLGSNLLCTQILTFHYHLH